MNGMSSSLQTVKGSIEGKEGSVRKKKNKWEEAEWKGECMKLECFASIATTNRSDLENLCAVEISFEKPF